MDHLLWNRLQEAASPGYLARMQARQQANYSKTYYWRPDESLPHAGPDFAKAIGVTSGANFAGNTE
jgi:hypothetical protein